MQTMYKTNCKYFELIGGVLANSYKMKHTTRVLDTSWIPIISWNFCWIANAYLCLETEHRKKEASLLTIRMHSR